DRRGRHPRPLRGRAVLPRLRGRPRGGGRALSRADRARAVSPGRANAMSTTTKTPVDISREKLVGYLEAVLGSEVEVLGLRPLGADGNAHDPKGLGYGVPFEVECVVAGGRRSYVVSRTRPAQGYGHDYLADRAWQSLHGH